MAELLIPITYPREVGDTCVGYRCEATNEPLRCNMCDFKGKFMCRVIGCNVYPKNGDRIPVIWKALSDTVKF
jgi:hypothetical protein